MPETPQPNAGENPPPPPPGPELRDFAICRSRRSGFGHYVDCLEGDACCCPCALRFGSGYFCLHPDHERLFD